MKLSSLASALTEVDRMGAAVAQGATSVTSIENDSRQVSPGSVFVAVKGFEFDGHKYIESAFEKGACVVVAQDFDSVDSKFADRCILVKDSRKALAELSCCFYGDPTKDLVVIGITGTNGKTSTAHILYELLKKSDQRVAIMSTIERAYNDFQHDMDHTTMEAHAIQQFARNVLDRGAKYLVLEVSSHAISLFRVHGCYFDQVIFTNFDIDHQDFYHGVEPYFQAKAELFLDFPNKFSKKGSVAILNQDDQRVRKLESLAKTDRVVTFGLLENAKYSGEHLQVSNRGIDGEIVGEGTSIKVRSNLTTSFNRYNLTAAVVAAIELGVSKSSIEAAIPQIRNIRGRLTEVPSMLPFRVFIDFAHSGTGLENVLGALREIAKARVIVVFGAGGEKDPLRREAMGRVAAELAEISIVTCDNPRRENPTEIINAIVEAWRVAVREKRLEREMLVEADRNLAIQKAIEWAEPDDIICIAGKGHERGQIVGTETFDFDDYEVAERHVREAENVQGRGNC